jgi:DNA-binding MarR family transcriptional regulator
MKLTRRQEEIIHKMLDLYHELQGPIHYSTLADRLGVSPFTAYDMLCLLEEKGLVSSEYQLAPDKSGPGRTVRVFLPTRQAQDLIQSLTEEAGGANWEEVKQRLLEKTRKGDIQDRELAQEIMARIPAEGKSQVQYCVEVMTIVALRIQSIEGRNILLKYFPEMLTDQKAASRTNLCLLGGFTLGILAVEDSGDREWGEQLFEHVQHYMNIVTKMNRENCRLLGEHLIQVFAIQVFAPLGEIPAHP